MEKYEEEIEKADLKHVKSRLKSMLHDFYWHATCDYGAGTDAEPDDFAERGKEITGTENDTCLNYAENVIRALREDAENYGDGLSIFFSVTRVFRRDIAEGEPDKYAGQEEDGEEEKERPPMTLDELIEELRKIRGREGNISVRAWYAFDRTDPETYQRGPELTVLTKEDGTKELSLNGEEGYLYPYEV